MEEKKGKILFVLAKEGFRDEEFFQPQKIVETAGFATETASWEKGEAGGKKGGRVKIDKSLAETTVAEYEAVVFVGGAGAARFFSDPIALALAQEAYQQGKVVAAICIAPSILANAGVLIGKKATSYPSEEENLRQKGAEFIQEKVVTDGRIITASGPEAASDFGWAIVTALQNPRLTPQT